MDSVAFYNSAQQHHNFYPQRQIHDHPYNLSHDEQIAYVSSPAPMSNVHDYCPPPAPKELALPNIGQTRCYWALLDKSLRFLTVDPALAYHLGIGLPNFLEAKLLDFVHPEERESARSDLGSVLEERTLHGSVTRVRYCRLSHIRRLMGVCDEQPPFPPTFPADRVAIDEQYMAVYLVVNCIAEGLVLCFIHAAVDIHSGADNDEHNKSGWTNWCSTHGFDIPEARALYNRLCETVMPTCVVPHNGPDQSLRVFQILKNIPNRPPILSWPPENLVYQQGYVSPSADVLARLSQYVQIGNSLTTTPASDARTSCTRRFKSVQAVDVPTSGGLKTVQVSSIFIPHGMIIFVCHKIEGGFLDSPPTSTSTVSSSSLETPIQQQQPGRNQVQPGHLNLHQLSQIASQEAQVVVNPHDPRAPYARFPYIQQWVNESHDPNAPPVQDLWVKGPFSQHPHAQQQQQQQWNTYAQPETPSSCSSSNMNNKGDLHWEQALGSYGGGGGGGGNGVLEHSHQEPSSGSSVLYGNGNGGGRPGSSSRNGPDSSTGPGPGQGGGGGGGSGSGGGGGLNGTPFAAAAYHHDQWSAPPQTWDTSGPGYLQSFARDPNASGSAEMYGNSPSDPGHPGALFAAATPTGSVGGGSVTGRVTPGLSGGVENGLQSDVVRVNGVGAGSVSGSTGGGGSRSASKKASRHSLKDGSPGPGTGGKAGRKSKGLGREPYTPAGRAEGKPPPGVANCSSCSTTVSPEWRKGPSGKKELCNACGLRFARSRAKKGAKNASSSPS